MSMVHLQDFHKAGFTEDYKFWKSDRVNSYGWKPYWFYTCPYCSNDEYVQAGVCNGVFESLSGSLKRGNKACRCGNYAWSQEQREYQINKVCKEEGLTFLGWENEGGYKNAKSKFKWLCSEGHKCRTSVDKFLNCGRRCKTCSDIRNKEAGNGNGYYPERKDETDYIYVINFNNEYIKVGRAFNIYNRLHHGSTGLLKQSGMSIDQLKILKVLTSNHKHVFDIEQAVHHELKNKGFYHKESTWTKETFVTDSEQLIYKLLEESDLMVV